MSCIEPSAGRRCQLAAETPESAWHVRRHRTGLQDHLIHLALRCSHKAQNGPLAASTHQDVTERACRALRVCGRGRSGQGFVLVGPALHYWYQTLGRVVTATGTAGAHGRRLQG